MFIIDTIKPDEATGELKLLYKIIKKNLGFIPAHFELFATIDLQAMTKFLEYNKYMMNHEVIDKNILPYLRLYIAKKEFRKYCINFNTQMLLNIGSNDKIIKNLENEPQNIPFDKKQKTILLKVFKALYEAEKFNNTDLEILYKLGFKHNDFFDLLSYASNFISRSKLIDVYLK
nr:hypothetical protein [Pseudodesulfovibrio sp.]